MGRCDVSELAVAALRRIVADTEGDLDPYEVARETLAALAVPRSATEPHARPFHIHDPTGEPRSDCFCSWCENGRAHRSANPRKSQGNSSDELTTGECKFCWEMAEQVVRRKLPFVAPELMLEKVAGYLETAFYRGKCAARAADKTSGTAETSDEAPLRGGLMDPPQTGGSARHAAATTTPARGPEEAGTSSGTAEPVRCGSCDALQARVAELEATLVRQDRVVLKRENIPAEAVARFWAKVDRSAGDDACWPWTGKSDRFHVTKRQAISNRRLSWLLAFGETWPVEIAVTCHNRACVNPAHFARCDADKFWSFVKKGDGCWEWQGGLVKKSEAGAERSYGAFAPRTGELYPAHRYSYELAYGKIEGHVGHDPEREICVCHHCDNPRCVRPDHLWLGSDADNVADAKAKGRLSHGSRHAQIMRRTRERHASDVKGGAP